MIIIIITFCDHVPRLPGEVISNTESWISFETDHYSVAAFSNLEAGKKRCWFYFAKDFFLVIIDCSPRRKLQKSNQLGWNGGKSDQRLDVMLQSSSSGL